MGQNVRLYVQIKFSKQTITRFFLLGPEGSGKKISHKTKSLITINKSLLLSIKKEFRTNFKKNYLNRAPNYYIFSAIVKSRTMKNLIFSITNQES